MSTTNIQCDLVSAVALDWTYYNGASNDGVGATLTDPNTGVQEIDYATVVLNQVILVAGQNQISRAPTNGIYKVTTAGAVGVSTVLTRATNYDTSDKITAPGMIQVKSGANAGTDWKMTIFSVIYIGSTAIIFQDKNGTVDCIADANLCLFDITDANVSTSAHGFAPKLPNDATKYLDGTGAYTVPAVTPGTLVLIGHVTASNQATVDFTSLSLSGYSHLTLVATSVIPITDNVQLYMRFSTGGTFDSGTNYLVNDFRFTNTASGIDGNGSLTAIPLTGVNEVLGTAANATVNTKVTIYEPAGATYKYINGEWCGRMHSGTFLSGITGAYWANTGAIDGIRILCASGNISSGKFLLYGVKNT